MTIAFRHLQEDLLPLLPRSSCSLLPPWSCQQRISSSLRIRNKIFLKRRRQREPKPDRNGWNTPVAAASTSWPNETSESVSACRCRDDHVRRAVGLHDAYWLAWPPTPFLKVLQMLFPLSHYPAWRTSLCTSIAADLTSGDILPLQQVKESVLHTEPSCNQKKKKEKNTCNKHVQLIPVVQTSARKQEVPWCESLGSLLLCLLMLGRRRFDHWCKSETWFLRLFWSVLLWERDIDTQTQQLEGL